MTTEERALKFLFKHRTYLAGLFRLSSEADGIEEGEVKELLEIIHEAEAAMEASAPTIKNKRHIFMIAIDADIRLSDNLIQNYVSRALKRFHSVDPDRTGWYENVNKPTFFIQKIVVADDEHTIRQTIQAINHTKNFLNRFYNQIY